MKPRSICWLTILSCTFAFSQQPPAHYPWIESGILQQNAGYATFSCNHPDAMMEAVRTIRAEYGWVISIEEPAFFSDYDLVDDTSPKWRAAHPNAKGARRVAGGRFNTTYKLSPDMSQSDAIETTLSKIIADYNSSGNPGRYEIRKLDVGIYSIVGVGLKDKSGAEALTQPVLDTLISVPLEKRSLYDTVQFILNQLFSITGKRAIMMTIPSNTFSREVTIGGENVPARNLLLSAFQASKRPLVWDLAYHPSSGTFLLNASVAMTSQNTPQGTKVHVAIDSPLLSDRGPDR